MNSTLNHAMNSANHTMHDVKSGARELADHGKTNLLEVGTQVLHFIGALRALEIGAVDSVLGKVGLSRRPSSLTPLMWLAAGAVIGGGVALALAPTSGKKLRARLSSFLDGGAELEKSNHRPNDDTLDDSKKPRVHSKPDGAGSPANDGHPTT